MACSLALSMVIRLSSFDSSHVAMIEAARAEDVVDQMGDLLRQYGFEIYYSHMLKYETLFDGVFRAKVWYFGENFYVRCFYGQVLNRKVSYLGVPYFSKRL